MKRFFGSLFTLIIGTVFSASLFVHAIPVAVAQGADAYGLEAARNETQYSTSKKTPTEIIGGLIYIALSVIGIVFLGLALYAGYKWMTAQGNEKDVTIARDTLINASIGLVLVVAAYTLTSFIFTSVITPMVSGGGGGVADEIDDSTPTMTDVPADAGPSGPPDIKIYCCYDKGNNPLKNQLGIGGPVIAKDPAEAINECKTTYNVVEFHHANEGACVLGPSEKTYYTNEPNMYCCKKVDDFGDATADYKYWKTDGEANAWCGSGNMSSMPKKDPKTECSINTGLVNKFCCMLPGDLEVKTVEANCSFSSVDASMCLTQIQNKCASGSGTAAYDFIPKDGACKKDSFVDFVCFNYTKDLTKIVFAGTPDGALNKCKGYDAAIPKTQFDSTKWCLALNSANGKIECAPKVSGLCDKSGGYSYNACHTELNPKPKKK